MIAAGGLPESSTHHILVRQALLRARPCNRNAPLILCCRNAGHPGTNAIGGGAGGDTGANGAGGAGGLVELDLVDGGGDVYISGAASRELLPFQT